MYCGPYKPVTLQKQNKRATNANVHAHDTIGKFLSVSNNDSTVPLPVHLDYSKHLTQMEKMKCNRAD